MEIILLETVRNLGDLGDTVKVANGYARNYLIPQKKAMRATDEAKAEVEERRRQLAADEGKRREVAQARADLAIREITLTRLVGEAGKLYGSVSPTDIAEALTEAGCRIEKAEIVQSDGVIKQTGEFTAEVTLHPEVRFEVKITVLGEGGEDAPAESDAPDTSESDAPDTADTSDTSETSETKPDI